jgi:hypothetical protein
MPSTTQIDDLRQKLVVLGSFTEDLRGEARH